MGLEKGDRLWLRGRPPWRPQLLDLGVLPRQVLPQRPSTFGCGGYSPNECSLDEYSTSEPSAFLTLACVGRRGSATASGVSRAEVERTEGGADDGSPGSGGGRASI